MQSKLTHIFVFVTLLFIPSCAFVSGSPVSGVLVTNVRVPGVSFPTADDLGAGSDLSNLAQGQASAFSILGLLAGGDASIQKAASNGKIKKIHHVDHDLSSFLGIYAKYTTIVYGER
jgi:TRL (tRNA-associated locus)-like protein